jgi:hypothetical protein
MGFVRFVGEVRNQRGLARIEPLAGAILVHHSPTGRRLGRFLALLTWDAGINVRVKAVAKVCGEPPQGCLLDSEDRHWRAGDGECLRSLSDGGARATSEQSRTRRLPAATG